MVGGLGGAQVVIATRKVKQESGKAFLESARKAGRDALLAGAPLVQLPSRYSYSFLWLLAFQKATTSTQIKRALDLQQKKGIHVRNTIIAFCIQT